MSILFTGTLIAAVVTASAANEELIAKNLELRRQYEKANHQAADIYEQNKALRREIANEEKTIAVMQQVLNSINKKQKTEEKK